MVLQLIPAGALASSEADVLNLGNVTVLNAQLTATLTINYIDIATGATIAPSRVLVYPVGGAINISFPLSTPPTGYTLDVADLESQMTTALSSATSPTMPFDSVEINVKYIGDTATTYTVKYYVQNLDGSYSEHAAMHTDGTAYQTVFDANAGDHVTAAFLQSADVPVGFEPASLNAPSGYVVPGGLLELEVRYNRKVSYIQFESNGGTYVAPITGMYEEPKTLPGAAGGSAAPIYSGHTFVGWYTSQDDATVANQTNAITIEEIGVAPITLYAGWNQDNVLVPYIIHFYRENLNTANEYADRNLSSSTNPNYFDYWKSAPIVGEISETIWLANGADMQAIVAAAVAQAAVEAGFVYLDYTLESPLHTDNTPNAIKVYYKRMAYTVHAHIKNDSYSLQSAAPTNYQRKIQYGAPLEWLWSKPYFNTVTWVDINGYSPNTDGSAIDPIEDWEQQQGPAQGMEFPPLLTIMPSWDYHVYDYINWHGGAGEGGTRNLRLTRYVQDANGNYQLVRFTTQNANGTTTTTDYQPIVVMYYMYNTPDKLVVLMDFYLNQSRPGYSVRRTTIPAASTTTPIETRRTTSTTFTNNNPGLAIIYYDRTEGTFNFYDNLTAGAPSQDGGSFIKSSSDIWGKAFKTEDLPESPTSSQYDFAGWFIDQACTIPFSDTSTYPQGNPVNVYAKWTPKQTFTVTFNNGAAPDSPSTNAVAVPEPITGILSGSRVSSIGHTIADPEWPGYEFLGWYDSAGNLFHFAIEPGSGTQVFTDVLLTARWTADPVGWVIRYEAYDAADTLVAVYEDVIPPPQYSTPSDRNVGNTITVSAPSAVNAFASPHTPVSGTVPVGIAGYKPDDYIGRVVLTRGTPDESGAYRNNTITFKYRIPPDPPKVTITYEKDPDEAGTLTLMSENFANGVGVVGATAAADVGWEFIGWTLKGSSTIISSDLTFTPDLDDYPEATNLTFVANFRERMIDVVVTKRWDGTAGYSPPEPSNITITLEQSGGGAASTATIQPTSSTTTGTVWEYHFDNLPMYGSDHSTLFVYTAVEALAWGLPYVLDEVNSRPLVDGRWTAELVNTYTPATSSITIIKTWPNGTPTYPWTGPSGKVITGLTFEVWRRTVDAAGSQTGPDTQVDTVVLNAPAWSASRPYPQTAPNGDKYEYYVVEDENSMPTNYHCTDVDVTP
jgi:uncharacterized repeat protein (TIGR02543 family)